jgi:UDP-N-acetylmuramate dehydrogenase
MGVLYDKLRELFKGEMVENEPMSHHTSFGIGGPAEIYCRPKDEEDLSRISRFAHSEGIPTLVLGNGTNLLVKDDGVSGIVIHPTIQTVVLDGDILTVGSALSLRELLQFCVENSVSGLEFMAGIPGSVGGALATNAGAYGHWFGEKILWYRGVEADGEVVERSTDSGEFSYRRWDRKSDMVIEAVRTATESDRPEAVRSRILEHLEKRRKSQPIGEKSAGSVFKNPANEHAGALLDRAGLKGKRQGGAEISSIHANFIVNKGGASALDVLALIELARSTVREGFGIELELEIQVVGRD